MVLALLTVALFALLMIGMSIGSILEGRCLRGSCGGPEVFGADGQPLSCDTCPLRKAQAPAGEEGD